MSNRMNMRTKQARSRGRTSKALAAMTVAGATLGFGGIAGADTFTAPAPASSSEAVAVQVDDVVTVGASNATADAGGASAGGVAVSVLGEQVSGGRVSGNASGSDAVLDTGDTPLGRLQVAPWQASSSTSPTSRQASSSSAAARADVVDRDTAHIDLLQSSSAAQHDNGRSTSRASSDAAVIEVGGRVGLKIVVAHAEGDSSGTGLTYLAEVNGTRVLEQKGASSCVVDLSPVLDLVCLNVTGGVSQLTASFLDVGVLDTVQANAITAKVTGGSGVAGSSATLPRTDDGTDVLGTVFNRGALATTGTSLGALAALAIALIALGTTLAQLGRLSPAWVPVRTR